MAAVTCQKCGAVVAVQSGAEGIEVRYGSSFRESCKMLRGSESKGFLGGPRECPHMREAIKRADFRITRTKKRTSRQAKSSRSHMTSVLEKGDTNAQSHQSAPLSQP